MGMHVGPLELGRTEAGNDLSQREREMLCRAPDTVDGVSNGAGQRASPLCDVGRNGGLQATHALHQMVSGQSCLERDLVLTLKKNDAAPVCIENSMEHGSICCGGLGRFELDQHRMVDCFLHPLVDAKSDVVLHPRENGDIEIHVGLQLNQPDNQADTPGPERA